jgi:hypothetical protein
VRRTRQVAVLAGYVVAASAPFFCLQVASARVTGGSAPSDNNDDGRPRISSSSVPNAHEPNDDVGTKRGTTLPVTPRFRGPVPMPQVEPAEPGPVPMPRVEPAEPGPVPMPRVQPPETGSRVLPRPEPGSPDAAPPSLPDRSGSGAPDLLRPAGLSSQR